MNDTCSMKIMKVPITKNQISNKYQWPKFKIQKRRNNHGTSISWLGYFRYWNFGFGYYLEFGFWDLGFCLRFQRSTLFLSESVRVYFDVILLTHLPRSLFTKEGWTSIFIQINNIPFCWARNYLGSISYLICRCYYCHPDFLHPYWGTKNYRSLIILNNYKTTVFHHAFSDFLWYFKFFANI